MDKIFQKLDRYFPSGWRVGVLDMDKGRWIVKPAISAIGYLKAENARGRHILIQPQDPSRYLLADDLNWDLILAHHRRRDGKWKPGRMVVETSPQNFQVWIHSIRPLSLLEKRYWLKRLMSDPGADPNNRWGRCPGFRNRKDKYCAHKTHYPLSRLIWIDWKGLAAVPQTVTELPSTSSKPFSHPPQRGVVCRSRKEISRSQYEGADQSATDFSYALALMRRGYPDNQIRQRILSERTDWHNHQGQRRISHYLDRTIRRAKAIINETTNA